MRPTFACASDNASRYTVSTSTGNGYLTYPIALLTADEINYAGIASTYANRSLNSYIMDNATYGNWWTMTPQVFDTDPDRMFTKVALVLGVGYLYPESIYGYGVRPTISLKPSVKFTGGNGSKTDPYTVG